MAVYYVNGQGYSTMGTPPAGSTSSPQATWNPYPQTNPLSSLTPNTVSGYTPYTGAAPSSGQSSRAAQLASLSSQLAQMQQTLANLAAAQRSGSSGSYGGSSKGSTYGGSGGYSYSPSPSQGYSYSAPPQVTNTRASAAAFPAYSITPTTGLTSVVTPTDEKNKSQLISEQELAGTKKSTNWLQRLMGTLNPSPEKSNLQLAGLGFIGNGAVTSPQGSVQNPVTTGHMSPDEMVNLNPAPSLWQTIQNKIGASADALGKARSEAGMVPPANIDTGGTFDWVRKSATPFSIGEGGAYTEDLSGEPAPTNQPNYSTGTPAGTPAGGSTGGQTGTNTPTNPLDPLPKTDNPWVNSTNDVVNGLFKSLNDYLSQQAAINADNTLTPEQKAQQIKNSALEMNPQFQAIMKQNEELDSVINNAMVGVRRAAEAIRNNPDLSVYQQQARLQQLDDINNYQPLYNGLSLKDLISYRSMLNDRLSLAASQLDKDTQLLLGLSDFQTNAQRTKEALGISSDYLNIISQIMGMGKKEIKDTQYSTDKDGNYFQIITYTDGSREVKNLGRLGKPSTTAGSGSGGSTFTDYLKNLDPNQKI